MTCSELHRLGVHRGLSDDGAPLSGEGRRKGLYLGFCLGSSGGGEGRRTGRGGRRGTGNQMGSPILQPTPWPKSLSRPHPESEEAPAQLSETVLGEAWAGSCPPSPPKTWQPSQPPAFTCRAAWAPLLALEDRPGCAGSGKGELEAQGRAGVVGVRTGGSPRRSAGRPRCCRSGREGGVGGLGRREGRGGAGPPPSSFHSHSQGPRPARPARPAQPLRRPPSLGPTLRHPHSHTHPGQSPSSTLCPQAPASQGLPSREPQTQLLRRRAWGFQCRDRDRGPKMSSNKASCKW